MNWPGRIVLLIVIAVSLALFLRKFLAALRIILAAKPDADFRLAPIGPRIRKVLWEVLPAGQSHPPTPAAGISARLRLLGLLRVRAGDAQPLRGRHRLRTHFPGRFFRKVLLLSGGGLRGCGRDIHQRPGVPSFSAPAEMAGPVSYLNPVSLRYLFSLLMVTYLGTDSCREASKARRFGGRTR